VDKTIVIWGAGKIGRGFVADLFHAAGYAIVLVDESPELVRQLRDAGRYTVVRAPGGDWREEIMIEGYTALATTEVGQVATAVVRADLMAVAVYPNQWQPVAKELAPCLLRRHQERPDVPLDILLCTNLMHAGPRFQRALEQALPPEAHDYLRSRIGIVETLVIRIASDPPEAMRQRDPLLVWTNGYPELPVARGCFRGPMPEVSALRMVDDMCAEEARKMYTYNMAHAVLAYQGARWGHDLITDCMADPKVHAEAEGALDEASRALQAEYGYSAEEMSAWTRSVLEQTNNPALGDTVKRYAADSRRKLRRDDRLVGPALLALKHGIRPRHIISAIAAGLRYVDANDAGATYVQERLSTSGLRGTICEICGLKAADDALVEAIIEAYHRQAFEDKWIERARRAYKLAFQYEREYHGCGQCTLAAVLESIDQFDEAVFRAATTLSGGLGLCGDATCGALTAAALAIGMVYPRTRANFAGDRDSKYRGFSMVQQLRERYMQRYGSITCHGIHRHEWGRPYDLRYEAEREAFEAAGAHEDKCTSVVAQAAKWAVEIIGAELTRDQVREQNECTQGAASRASASTAQ
jgi:mannitol-1-phosphate 5-dehydrogenase